MIYCEYDRYRFRIQSEGAYSITRFDLNKPWYISPGQFPGLYMGLTGQLPELSIGEIAIVFSKEILKQSNWHFNLYDRNGTFGYDTYTYENFMDIPKFADVEAYYLKKIGRYHNEVVFHGSVP